MANEKKKLSKSAKLAAKLLKESNLAAALKTANESNSTDNKKVEGFSPKLSTANKMRPEKKRG